MLQSVLLLFIHRVGKKYFKKLIKFNKNCLVFKLVGSKTLKCSLRIYRTSGGVQAGAVSLPVGAVFSNVSFFVVYFVLVLLDTCPVTVLGHCNELCLQKTLEKFIEKGSTHPFQESNHHSLALLQNFEFD